MTKNRNLVIFSEVEKFALYGLPDFDNKQRREYFSFSENELSLIRRSQHDHINIYCALQIAYFKAKKMFFQFSWKDIPQEDLQFIIDHYFQDKNLSGSSITNHEYYNQRKAIATLFGYQLWSKEYLHVLHCHCQLKRDQLFAPKRDHLSQKFLAHGNLTFLILSSITWSSNFNYFSMMS